MYREKGIKYYFINDRGTEESFLIITGEKSSKYICEYYNSEGEKLRESTINKHGVFCQRLRREEMKEFYIVWSPEGHTNPTRRYETKEAAKLACEYLINTKKSKEVYILKKVMKASILPEIRWED